MSEVSRICPRDRAQVDRGRYEELVLIMGIRAAEGLLARTVEQLAICLNRAERCYRASDLDRLVTTATNISALAEQVGMIDLARAARAVADTAETWDPVALGATMARLTRVGDVSLLSAWDLDELPL